MSNLISSSKDKPIYKVKQLVNGSINTIYVFNGKTPQENKEELFKNVFTELEKQEIKSKNITVKFAEQQIHFDDSIGTIKIKILNELKKEIILDEIYLYYQTIKTLNAVSVYKSLTQNNKLQLTKVRLEQFISNIVSDENGKPVKYHLDKELYTFDDIFEMNFDNKKFIINNIVGQQSLIIENEYPFVCNPFHVNDYDKFFERSTRKSLTSLNNCLLLNSSDIIDNSIYLCLAEDVLSYLNKKEVSQETTIKIYYPFLYNKNINNLEELESKKDNLIENKKKIINEKIIESFKTIDLFYDVYNERKTELNYINKGIKFIKVVIKPDFDIKIPLEVIFKVIHATEENPFIKFNPSSRQENIYRLYTDKIATDGRKIPYLKKGSIFKLMKTIARNKSVAVYIETEKNGELLYLICEFDEEGFITISSEFKSVLTIDVIDNLFKTTVNPIIQEIKTLLEQSGYKLNMFNSLNDENVEIKQLTYETQIAIKKTMDIQSYRGCVSSVFIDETNVFKKSNTINLRFKRVSNYSKFNSIEAFILEKSNQGLRGEQIIEALIDNFKDDLDRNQALEIISKFANELEIERGVRKTDIKIKNNPGFKTLLKLEQETGIITITTENINNINYYYTLPIYLDTLVRLTQDKKTTKYPIKEINKLCSTGDKEEIIIDDIISLTDKSGFDLEADGEEIQYNKFTTINKPKGAFSLFFDEDEDNEFEGEERKDFEGGNSESSIESEKTEVSKKLDSFDLPSSPEESIESEKTEVSKKDYDINEYSIKEKSFLITKDSEDSEEDSGEDTGENEYEEEIRNIDGMRLNKPYYFQTLIENKDPILILKEDTPQFNSYVRTCSSSLRKQPVILTDSQLDKINKEHPGFLREEDVIKYGSDEKHQYNYICPRYWCLKNNTIIDPNELKEVIGKDGKKELLHPTCGKVLPKGEKNVKPGYYIYEFYKQPINKKDYKRYPGFIPDSHPDGFCLPCCFDKYNTEGRIKANKKCYGNIDKDEKKTVKDKVNEKVEDEYIKGPDKFPLNPGRWGYLPPEIQTILNEVNSDCQISKTNTNIKDNHPCLLRHGIEINNKQSFVACISDVIFFGKKILDENKKPQLAKILTIKEMRNRIIKSISIDSFIKYQNGNLVTDFHNPNRKIDINKYKNTKLYSKLNNRHDDSPELAYYIKVISAFENFTDFLNDDDAIIDHTYLWDIVSMPNKYLFPQGVNLVIFKIPKDDITNNIELLCPTNHYSSEFYESRKPTIIIMKEDNYYEPLYTYTTNNKEINVAKEFKEYDPHLSKTIRDVFKEIIKPFFKIICKPLDSMPNVYKAKRPLLLYDLVQKLDKYEYKIKKLVVNFNNKVIGVFAEEPGVSTKTGFIPCYPSAIDEDLKQDLDFVFMTDLTLWNTYDNTIKFLNKLDNRSKKRKNDSDIPCKPAFKVIEEEHVVGILTNTNQFIQLSQPLRLDQVDIDLDIPSLNNDNYIINKDAKPMVNTEVEITTKNDVDHVRVDYIKKIRLETNFYNVFRNTIRILLNDYENYKIREKIEKEMLKEYIIYSEKLKNINNLLHDLVKNKIQFTGDNKYYKLINEISTCLVKDKNTCKDTPNLCAITENGICNLILPEKNLLQIEKDNEPIYYGRMADELIRYNRIKSFMLQPQTYLSFGNIGYNLRENEIILIQSLLTQEYFETLIPSITNKYIKYNSYDETQPIISNVYDNTIPYLDKSIITKNESNCVIKNNKYIKSSIWKKCFPNNYSEIEYSKSNVCTFNLITDLIERKTGKKILINQIKNELYEEYKKYLEKYINKITTILILEGKKTLGDQVLAETLSFSSLIYTDNYFLTTLDLWLLVTKYEIPTIFISQKYILQTKYEKQEYLGYGNENDKFAFIIIPSFITENIPGYKLIQSNDGDVFISLDKIENDCVEKIRETFKNKISIEEYLEKFTKPLIKNKKPTRLVIESDSDNEKLKIKTKTKLLIEDTTPITEEEYILPLLNKNRKTKKKQVKLKGDKFVNKKNTKKRRLLIVNSSNTEKN